MIVIIIKKMKILLKNLISFTYKYISSRYFSLIGFDYLIFRIILYYLNVVRWLKSKIIIITKFEHLTMRKL